VDALTEGGMELHISIIAARKEVLIYTPIQLVICQMLLVGEPCVLLVFTDQSGDAKEPLLIR
jgi:hypothetical protein